MTLEIIRWLANQLRLALLEEGETGSVQGNPSALVALRGETPSELSAGALQLLGEVDDAAVREAIESARAGKQAAYSPAPAVQMLAIPISAGRAAVLVTSQESPLPESI